MKLAAARAGAWFFGSIIFIMLFLNDMFKNMKHGEAFAMLVFYGFLAGGAAFFWTWHQIVNEERELIMAERRKALERENSDTTK